MEPRELGPAPGSSLLGLRRPDGDAADDPGGSEVPEDDSDGKKLAASKMPMDSRSGGGSELTGADLAAASELVPEKSGDDALHKVLGALEKLSARIASVENSVKAKGEPNSEALIRGALAKDRALLGTVSGPRRIRRSKHRRSGRSIRTLLHKGLGRPGRVERSDSSDSSSTSSGWAERTPRPRRAKSVRTSVSVPASSDNGGYDQERLGPIFLRNILKYSDSVYTWVHRLDWRNQRKEFEARSLGQAIDALLQEGLSSTSEGLEILLRRLVAIQKADERKDDSIIRELEWKPREDVVPRSVLRRVIKDAERSKRLRPKTPSPWHRPSGGPRKPSAESKKPSGKGTKLTFKSPKPDGDGV